MKFLSYGVMTYTLLALIWWSVLLTRNNKNLYDVKKELTVLKQSVAGAPDDKALFKIEKEYHRNRWMIIGEGSVFGILLIVGVWFIQRAYQKDIRATTKQKNFLLSITHELKSPIAAISLIMETLLKRDLDKGKQKDLYNNVLHESHRLEKLIHNLLISAKLDEGYNYNFELNNIKDILEKLSQNYKIQHSHLNITVESAESVSEIMIDKEAIESIMINVIENSIKYSKNSPVIQVKVEQNHLNTTISCIDNGIGIPDIEKSRITEQFYRIGNEETRDSKGTGLGLNIVQQIVKAHKGQLKFEDNTPQGLVIKIILPNKITE